MRKDRVINFILIVAMLVGMSLLLYPPFSNYWNSRRQSYAIANYAEEVAHLDKDKYRTLWDAALAYNKSLLTRGNSYLLTPEQRAEYDSLLNLATTGVMGYVENPEIQCSLPVYHGTDEAVLQVAIGHLEWSSLPTGGESTHCVLSGHRGLPSAKLFTDLDRVEIGDLFMLRILDELLTYEVDRIDIVEPHQTQTLLIEEGKDLCTLVTCTPYGINSHRLLVRGHRVENTESTQTIRVTADAIQIEPVIVAPVVAAPILLLLMIAVMLPGKKKSNQVQGKRRKRGGARVK